MILIFSLAILACLCLVLMNSKFILTSSSKAFDLKANFIKESNEWYLQFIPSQLKRYVESNIIYTKIDKKKFYKEMFYVSLISFVIFVAYFVTLKIYLLFLALLVLLITPLDFSFKVDSGKKSFVDSLDHLVSCLEILTVKSETPLSNSLKIVADSLPADFYVARNEIKSLLQKSEKLGMEQVLHEIDRDSIEEQEFISILIAILKGTNKSALKKNLTDFLIRQKAIKEEKRKLIVENMQLYLMLPGTLMLIIAMYPLIDMILFQLEGAF
jgi:hypothetical protein